MRALIAKELVPLLAPAAVAACLCFAALRIWCDPHGTFFAAPSDALAPVALLACALGATLGLQQLKLERERDTLSYLLHRDVAPGRVLLAKCVAAWAALALVLAMPLCAEFALECATSPLGPVLQVERLVELLGAGALAIPAHALGLFATGLRGGRLVRSGALTLGAIGLVLGVGLATWLPLGPTAARLGIGFALAALTVLLLRAARARLTLHDDPTRAPRPSEIAAALVVIALFAWPLLAILLSGLQGSALASVLADRPAIAWHPELGVALAERVEGQVGVRYRMRDASGAVVAELRDRPGAHVRRSSPELARPEEEWTIVWDPRVGPTASRARSPFTAIAAPPNVAPKWRLLDARNGFDGEHLNAAAPAPVVLEVDHDRARGRFLALIARTADAGANARRWPIHAPELAVRVRGDGRRFSERTTARSGAALDRIVAFDPVDRTTWRWDPSEPSAGFELVTSPVRAWMPEPVSFFDRERLAWSTGFAPRSIGEDTVPVRAIASGDRLTATVRVVDARTDAELLEHRYALAGAREHLTAALLVATELLRPPARTVQARLALPPEAALEPVAREAGLLAVAGLRTTLVLANVAFALALALWARARLARRGAGRGRVATWMIAIAALGPIAVVALLLLEPPGPAIASAAARTSSAPRVARRPPPLVESAAAEAVPR